LPEDEEKEIELDWSRLQEVGLLSDSPTWDAYLQAIGIDLSEVHGES
jgi:hypothetical protein